jgi:phosphoglycerate dehydrogenase-like enzyme
MKVFMIGEAANHKPRLAARLPGVALIGLPREAGHEPTHDGVIGPEDVLISLRFSRRKDEIPAFRLLHVPGAGTDGIDFGSLPPSAWVCNVFEHEIPIAEFVCASMLQWEIRLDDLGRSFSAERWPDLYRKRVPHGELHGKTLGVIGFGRIGQAVARRARAFAMRVIALAPRPVDPDGLADEALPTTALARLLGEADYVVIACPLNAETRGLIGGPQLRTMKPTAVLINVARAEILDEEALFHALSQKIIHGASLDVWYQYPEGTSDRVAPSRFPFHDLDNALCTPHASAWTVNLPERRYAVIAHNLQRLMAGEPLENVVRRPLLEPNPAV